MAQLMHPFNGYINVHSQDGRTVICLRFDIRDITSIIKLDTGIKLKRELSCLACCVRCWADGFLIVTDRDAMGSDLNALLLLANILNERSPSEEKEQRVARS
jgi:hypothetical protein